MPAPQAPSPLFRRRRGQVRREAPHLPRNVDYFREMLLP